jgi:dTDP-4-dehydrorhamnose 3,5-epimerase
MSWIKIEFEGVWVFEPRVWGDDRGYFFESFNAATLEGTDIENNFVQDNEAMSTRGVLRGLHYQVGSNAQSKLVRAVIGEILDVIVDLRPRSDTYGKHFSILLNESNKKQLFVPKGFAHGYVVLSETAIFSYKCDGYYDKAGEGGLLWSDPTLNIDWMIPNAEIILSDKDKVQPIFGDHLVFAL